MGQVISEQSDARPDWDALVGGLRNHDGAATEALYAALRPALRAFILRRISDPDDADDCVADCWAAMLHEVRKREFPESIPLDRYLWGIAKNLLKGWIARRAAARGYFPIREDLRDSALNPEDIVMLKERMHFTARAIANLSPLDQEILRRFYLEGQSPAQIQASLAISESRFRVRKHRAKATVTTRVANAMIPAVSMSVSHLSHSGYQYVEADL